MIRTFESPVRLLAVAVIAALGFAASAQAAGDTFRFHLQNLELTANPLIPMDFIGPEMVVNYDGVINAVSNGNSSLMAMIVPGGTPFGFVSSAGSDPAGYTIDSLSISATLAGGIVQSGAMNFQVMDAAGTESFNASLVLGSGDLNLDILNSGGNKKSYLLDADITDIVFTDTSGSGAFLGIDVPGPNGLVGSLFQFSFMVVDNQFPVAAEAKVDVTQLPGPPPTVPLPSAALAGSAILGLMGFVHFRRRRNVD